MISNQDHVRGRREMNGIDRKEIPLDNGKPRPAGTDKINAGEYGRVRDILLRVVKIAPHLLHPLIEIGTVMHISTSLIRQFKVIPMILCMQMPGSIRE